MREFAVPALVQLQDLIGSTCTAILELETDRLIPKPYFKGAAWAAGKWYFRVVSSAQPYGEDRSVASSEDGEVYNLALDASSLLDVAERADYFKALYDFYRHASFQCSDREYLCNESKSQET